MPTPVSTAKQCLTSESSQALDEAVVVAHRRGHSQTTSLHATSAFLSHSILRDACSRIQSSTYSSRLQFRALELCFGSALDRLPSQTLDAAAVVEPPISNSLMAAIKRSQANQRRHPDSFHLYQQQQQQQSSFSCVKVELQHLILSILDDPVVSKVFGEAGFRSCDVRLAILRPLPRRCPPLFLCNLPTRVGIGGDSSLGQRGFSFPFSNFPGFYGGVSDGCDENCKRIGEVLVQDKKRNPLLVGFWALDALRSFSEVVVGRKTSGVLPVEVSGLSFFDIEKEVSCGNEGLLRMKMEELDRVLMENCERVGVVVSFGDLNVFVADESNGDFVSYVVSQLTRLLEVHRGKLWLIGGTASYEMYLQFLLRFPTIEKDWDLHLLTITSLKPSMSGFQSRPHRLATYILFLHCSIFYDVFINLSFHGDCCVKYFNILVCGNSVVTNV
ncbi:hypothetical protein GIB67_036757 [Kingdonia uniflora]|uniref:Clp R domain-containing protein n=1 Tax=Kingdonia uniflora TaxID=39325 RepID=A0A7J7LWW4_9MAGN|nr:hypothetical protein GIB67_036757 [Kingdonia uniflora]